MTFFSNIKNEQRKEVRKKERKKIGGCNKKERNKKGKERHIYKYEDH